MKIFCWSSYIILWLFCHLTVAQNPLFFKYTDENGLPDSEVYELTQDTKGFLWIATSKGLVRYDGTTFKQYSSTKQVNASLTGILEDAEHRIWVHDFTGRMFYLANDSLHYLDAWNPNNSFSFPQIYNNSLGIWVVTYEGCYLFGTTGTIRLKKKWQLNTYRSLTCTRNTAYITCPSRVLQINANLDTVSLTIPNDKLLDSPNNGYSYQVQGEDYLFFSKKSAIYKVNQAKKQLEFVQTLANNDFTYKGKKIGQKFYICTANGLHVFDLVGTKWKKKAHYFQGIRVSNIIQDHEGYLWLSTLNNGLLQIPTLNTKNIIIPNDDKALKVRAYAKGFILGTDQGKVFKNNELIFQDTFQRGISALNIKLTDETLLVAGNYLYEIKKNKVQQTYHFNHGFKQWEYLPNDIYLYGTSSGFGVEISPKTKLPLPPYLMRSIPHTYNTATYWHLTDLRCSFFVHDTLQQCILVATKNGLLNIDNQKTDFVQYQGKPFYAISIEKVNDTYWAGTATNGIFILDKNKNVVKHLTTTEGLLGNAVYRIKKAEKSVWIATDNGLQQLDFQYNVKNYLSTQNGLFSNKINDISIWQDTIYAATNKGVLIFPENFNNSLFPSPKIYLKNLQWQTDEMRHESTSLQPISLPFGYRRLVIELGIISFGDKNRIGFKYILKGLHNEHWTNAKTTENRIDLAALPAGNYLFEAYALNPQGNTSGTALQIPIMIEPPFWRTSWFWLIVLTLLGGLITVLIVNRLKRIKERNSMKLEKEKLQKELQMSLLASIKSQMNPHFIFNALNTIQFYIFNNDKTKATHYLSKFSQLMRKILQMSNAENVSLKEELEALKLYLTLEAMRFQEELLWQIQVGEDIDIEETYIPSMLIQPYIENAIKHGLLHQHHEKKLTITILTMPHQILQVNIEDNGIGRKKAEEMKLRKGGQHLSYSSNANHKRLAILNANSLHKISLEIIDLENSEGEGIGTKVILFIPFTVT